MLIDSHIHYDISGSVLKIIRALNITSADYCCLQSQIYKSKINQNMDCFFAKLLCKGRVYINIALDSTLYDDWTKMDQMPDYLKRMMECGADGIKMIEGKPTTRKEFNIPNFDDPLFDSTFKYLEDQKIPITWHVNDPEEFWDEKKVPDWARRSGWFYADGTYVNNLDQYKQVDNLLKKHPNLVITFAHFFFLSQDLKRLGELFDTYPNVSVDITPGVELFTNMSSNIEEAKAFFKKYADRILYGTDISVEIGEKNELNEDDAIIRFNLCHDFLTKKHFVLPGNKESLLGSDDLVLNGLELNQEEVEKSESLNFLRRYNEVKPLNIPKILVEIEKHQKALIQKGLDTSYLNKIKEAFENYGK